MKKVTLLIALAALVIFAGCKKDKETTGTTLTASIEQYKGGDSKTSIVPVDPTTAEIRWTLGDKIVVNNGTTSGTFSLTSGAGSTTGTFTYTGEYTFGENNIAVYPETATVEGNTVTVTLPAEQTYAAERNGSTPMLGTFTNPDDLTFTSLCGALGISLKAASGDIAITAIEVVSKTNEKLNGTFTCTTANPQLTVAAGDSNSKKVRLNCNTTLTSTEAQTFYFAMPVDALSGGFTLNVYGDGADPIFTKETTTGNQYTIVLKQVNQMPTLEVASEPEHAYVDLGLPSGLLWATCNVGANAPEEYGDYFAWGETTPKDTYNWGTYQYCNGSSSTLTKYCNNSSFGYNGFTDDLTTLLPEDDAATANWGSGWRMPTKAEFEELYNNTTVTWTQQNGVNGRLFTASNGNSLFLPAAGYRYGGSLYDAGSDGYYWSSSFYTENPYYAWRLGFYSGYAWVSGFYRYNGYSLRPVLEN